MPMEVTLGKQDFQFFIDPSTGKKIPNPDYRPPAKPTETAAPSLDAGATGPAPAAPEKKKAYFDKKSGAILFEDGTHPKQVYDKAQHRRFYQNGEEWLPVPLSEDEETAAKAVTVAQGVLMGGGDEFLAAVANPLSATRAAFGAEPQNGAYYKDLEQARELDTRYADENPVTSVATKIVAGIPTAIATGGMAAGALTRGAAVLRTAAPTITTATRVAKTLEGAAKVAPTVGGRIAQGGTGGAVYGTITGYASGEGDNRGASAAWGAAGGALVGSALQSLSPVARWTYNLVNDTPKYWNPNTSTLTTEGRRAVIQAGGDPDQISKEIADAFAKQMRLAADPKTALVSAQVNSELATPVHLTRGQISGNPADQMLESRARQGSMGDTATKIMRESDDATRKGLFDNVEAVRNSSSGGRAPILPNQGGATAQKALTRAAETAKAAWSGAYKQAQSAGDATVAPTAFNDMSHSILQDLAAFHPSAFKKTWSVVMDAFQFDHRQNSGRLISSLFRAREQLVKLQGVSDESAAATAAKHAFDRAINNITPEMMEGNPAAIRLWQKAIQLRAKYGRDFERGPVGKIVERDPITKTLKMSAEEVSDKIIGKDVSMKGGLLRDIVAIRNQLGEASPEWLDFKQDVVLRILDKSRGGSMSGRGIEASGDEIHFSATKFADHLNDLLRKRPGLMRFLFTPRELKVLQATAKVAKMTVPAEGGKQLGSGGAIASMIQSTFPAFWRAIKFTADLPGIKGTVDAVQAAGPRKAVMEPVPSAMRSYSTRNAVAGTASQGQATSMRDRAAR